MGVLETLAILLMNMQRTTRELASSRIIGICQLYITLAPKLIRAFGNSLIEDYVQFVLVLHIFLVVNHSCAAEC